MKSSQPINEEALKLENQLCFPLYAASRLIIKQYKPFLDPLDLTYTQYLVMLALWENDGDTVNELGKKLFLDSGTLTPLLKKIESQGFIRRERDTSDERNVRIFLTASGKKLKQRALEVPGKVASCVNISRQEGQMMHTLLHQLIKSLSAV